MRTSWSRFGGQPFPDPLNFFAFRSLNGGCFGGQPFPDPLNSDTGADQLIYGFGGQPFPDPLNSFSASAVNGVSFGGQPFPDPLNFQRFAVQTSAVLAASHSLTR